MRCGAGEVIYGAGKTPEQIAGIVDTMLGAGQQRILITRLTCEKAHRLHEIGCPFEYHAEAQAGVVGAFPEPDGNGEVLIITAGTSDAPVAAEAELTARFLGNRVTLAQDAGVAGIHRLLAHAERIASAQVIVAIAGMEGALPSVVAGLASCPVIAVPTSVGYGANLGGITALLAMVNSCASGVRWSISTTDLVRRSRRRSSITFRERGGKRGWYYGAVARLPGGHCGRYAGGGFARRCARSWARAGRGDGCARQFAG